MIGLGRDWNAKCKSKSASPVANSFSGFGKVVRRAHTRGWRRRGGARSTAGAGGLR